MWRSGSYTSTADDENNWWVAIEDDDPDDRFCTPMSGVTVADENSITEAEYLALEAEWYYECEEIRCVH